MGSESGDFQPVVLTDRLLWFLDGILNSLCLNRPHKLNRIMSGTYAQFLTVGDICFLMDLCLTVYAMPRGIVVGNDTSSKHDLAALEIPLQCRTEIWVAILNAGYSA